MNSSLNPIHSTTNCSPATDQTAASDDFHSENSDRNQLQTSHQNTSVSNTNTNQIRLQCQPGNAQVGQSGGALIDQSVQLNHNNGHSGNINNVPLVNPSTVNQFSTQSGQFSSPNDGQLCNTRNLQFGGTHNSLFPIPNHFQGHPNDQFASLNQPRMCYQTPLNCSSVGNFNLNQQNQFTNLTTLQPAGLTSSPLNSYLINNNFVSAPSTSSDQQSSTTQIQPATNLPIISNSSNQIGNQSNEVCKRFHSETL